MTCGNPNFIPMSPLNAKKMASKISPKTSSRKKIKPKDDITFNISEEDNDMDNYYSNRIFQKYDKNLNPLISGDNPEISAEKLNDLSNLAFKNEEDEKENEKNEDDIPILDPMAYALLMDENSIMIDGKMYHKGTQLDKIAGKVLKNCNVYKKKSIFNKSTLKKNNGKLMFTNGMTIGAFEDKYGLNLKNKSNNNSKIIGKNGIGLNISTNNNNMNDSKLPCLSSPNA